MVALQIRDVPEEVRDALAQRAHARGQSLQAFLFALLQAEARRSGNVTLLDRFAARTDGSTLSGDEAAAAIGRAREEREDGLAGRPGPETGGTG